MIVVNWHTVPVRRCRCRVSRWGVTTLSASKSHPTLQFQVVPFIFHIFHFTSLMLAERSRGSFGAGDKIKAILIEPLSHKLRGSLWEICHVQRSQPPSKSPNNKTLISFGDTEWYQRAHKEIRWCVWDDVHLTPACHAEPHSSFVK